VNFVDPTSGFGGFAKEWCQTNFHSSRLVHEISFGFDLVFVIPTSLSLSLSLSLCKAMVRWRVSVMVAILGANSATATSSGPRSGLGDSDDGGPSNGLENGLTGELVAFCFLIYFQR